MAPDITWHASNIDRAERWAHLGTQGATVWFTGLSGSGKSTLAAAVEASLIRARRPALLLDGDNLRHGLNSDLGMSAADRNENVRRTAEVARIMAEAGMVALVALISPYRAGRALARSIHQTAGLPFLEVWVDTPLAECEARDPKGLYAKARAGLIKGFTGIDAPYEEPTSPELIMRASTGSMDDAVGDILCRLTTGRG